jgi:hypothetical protein
MADWVSDYMASRQQAQAQNADDARTARIALAGASQFFRVLAGRVRRDVEQFHTMGGDKRLVYSFVPSHKFIVRRPDYPAVCLTATLNDIFIQYELVRISEFGSTEEPIEGQFRIDADLKGRLQAVQGGVKFTDPAEISQILLKIVFDQL